MRLFVIFADFYQAYDSVSRHVIFRVLGRSVCGTVRLSTLVAIFVVTESVIGTAV